MQIDEGSKILIVQEPQPQKTEKNANLKLFM